MTALLQQQRGPCQEPTYPQLLPAASATLVQARPNTSGPSAVVLVIGSPPSISGSWLANAAASGQHTSSLPDEQYDSKSLSAGIQVQRYPF